MYVVVFLTSQEQSNNAMFQHSKYFKSFGAKFHKNGPFTLFFTIVTKSCYFNAEYNDTL